MRFSNSSDILETPKNYWIIAKTNKKTIINEYKIINSIKSKSINFKFLPI